MSVSGVLKKRAESSKRKRRKELFRAFWKTRSSLGVAAPWRTTFSRICARISAINSQNTAPLAWCPPAPRKGEAERLLPRSHPCRPGSKGSKEESRRKNNCPSPEDNCRTQYSQESHGNVTGIHCPLVRLGLCTFR